jgi:hypothetical protein
LFIDNTTTITVHPQGDARNARKHWTSAPSEKVASKSEKESPHLLRERRHTGRAERKQASKRLSERRSARLQRGTRSSGGEARHHERNDSHRVDGGRPHYQDVRNLRQAGCERCLFCNGHGCSRLAPSRMRRRTTRTVSVRGTASVEHRPMAVWRLRVTLLRASHAFFARAAPCRTIAIYEYAP